VILAGDDAYWDGLLRWINDTLVARGKVRADEVGILKRAADPRAVIEILKSTPVPPRED
jgi:predicted Rossmann-fold nucleotide-binding protein